MKKEKNIKARIRCKIYAKICKREELQRKNRRQTVMLRTFASIMTWTRSTGPYLLNIS